MTNTTPKPKPLEPAEIDKLAAEAQAARAAAQHSQAQAREATARAIKAELELNKTQEDEQTRINSDHHHHVYQFNGQVSDGTVNTCMASLRMWDRIDPTCPIEIIFNSPGGGVIAGMALFDLIVRLSQRGGGQHHITVGSQGWAASMGGILLQSGDNRWIGRQSYLMIHELSAGTSGKIGEMKDDVKWYEAVCERVVNIFVDRADGKITRKKFVDAWTRTDWWLSSDEALKFGFVDEIR